LKQEFGGLPYLKRTYTKLFKCDTILGTTIFIFGFEQDYYLDNGLDCNFEKRYSFDETVENGKYLDFFSRRLVSLSSYALFVFIIWFLLKQLKILFALKN